MSTISNVPLESLGISDQQRMEIPVHVTKIVLSVDHIGVRRVQFMDRNSDPSPDGSPWYEILEVRDSHVDAHVLYDVRLLIPIRTRSALTKINRAFLFEAFGLPRTFR